MHSIFLTSGRYACVVGLKNLGLKTGDKILMPDYICSTLVKKIKEYKFGIKFYNLKFNFKTDWKSVNDNFDSKIKAIMMVNYFGQPQEISKFIQFSKKKKIYLVEDNSHGYQNRYKGKILGTFGDIGFSSPYKKIPNLISGGILYSKKPIDKNLIKSQYKPTLFEHFKTLIKDNFTWIKKVKLYFNDYDYLNPNLSFDAKIEDGAIDNYSMNKINNTNILKINNNLIKNHKIYSNLFKKIFLDVTFFKNNNVPWKLVLITKNEKMSSKILRIGRKKDFSITTWPSLPIDIIKNKSRLISNWKRILVVSIDKV